ncbi:lysosomal alpha-mannosidase-like [Cydia pomonella]|uniref:lysosomal alpha-mannosidase-like n=1 Tax=Cydia pomonella TaxID=82600 RepID=UPI002ADDA162|nr:lysosomal alpha-mannosidase-like [Cydia pomonella]
MLLLVLLLAQSAHAQYEPKKDDGVDVLTTPMHGEACGYASCLPIQPGWLNVHIVPQTHSELGHGYNFHQHFTGEDPPFPKNSINMKRILDSILTELWNNVHRRFTLSDTAYLFHWWKNRHPAVHRMMYQLVRQGRLTIVGGGLGVTDEASTNYHAIIDQFSYSLRKLNATFRACARPLVAWAADVYGHSREFTSLMAQMGYDALFINPISYDEEVARMRRKSLEFLWRGSDDLGPSTDMFTHNLFDGYWAPPGFCFSKLCSDPLLVTSSQLFSDVQDRVDKFIEGVLYRQAPNFETRNVMVIMGHRKAYADAHVWFDNIEKLIGYVSRQVPRFSINHGSLRKPLNAIFYLKDFFFPSYTNWRAAQKQLNVTLFFSNPPCYLAAVHDENPELETKQDDFFPYVHDKDSYTVGMYSSRPTFKYLIREAHVYLQIAKQMQITANMGPYTKMFEDFNWVMGVVQDHSVASGVLRDRVKQYYTSKIDAAVTKSTDFISKAFTKLRSSPKHVTYYRCQFNISSCYGSRFIKYSVSISTYLHVTVPASSSIGCIGNLNLRGVAYLFICKNRKRRRTRSFDVGQYASPRYRRCCRWSGLKTLVGATSSPNTRLGPPGASYVNTFPQRRKMITRPGFHSVDLVINVIMLSSDLQIQVYNPLGWPVTTPVRLPVYPTNSVFKVYGNEGEEVKSATIRLPDTILRIKGRPSADYEVVFIAANIPPVGFRSYYIEAQFFKGKMLIERGGERSEDYEDDTQEKTMPFTWKDSKQQSRPRKYKHEMKVLGLTANKREKKMIAPKAHNTQNITKHANGLQMVATEVLKDTANNYMKDRIHVEDVDNYQIESTTGGEIMLPMLKEFTTEAGVMLPMLRDFLQKSKVLNKLEFVDTEKELLSSHELEHEPVTETEFETTNTTEADIKIPFRKNITRFSDIQDIMVEPDIKVPIIRPTKGPTKKIPHRIKPEEPYFRPFTTTAEPDIRVFTPTRDRSDIKILVNTDIKVPVNKSTVKTKARKFSESVEFEAGRTESLAIVPVQTTSTTSAVYVAEWSSTTESVLVVPVRKMWEQVTVEPKLKLEMERQDAETKNNEEILEYTTESVNLPVNEAQLEKKVQNVIPQAFNVEASRNADLVDTDPIVDTGAQNEDIEQIENSERFRTYSLTTEEVETFVPYLQTTEEIERVPNEENVESTTGVESTTTQSTDYIYISSSTDNIRSTEAYDTKILSVSPLPMATGTTNFAVPTDIADPNEKYFKVDDGSRLFIGNKYVRVNLDKRRRVSSIFLRNGVRINLEILMFHYVSDDPAKFDIRTVPRRDIKPPGAYIFRPIDPYIIRSEDKYDVDIIKTDIVEEMHITFSNWTSLQLRLYVDSPVIELHWLVGPIPTDDGLGKEVFIRYKTDLDHDGAFYTDSSGRQTIKRIRGRRATYEPVDLDPITGNLYPVTSKIYIEDQRKNIRFSVFNDRCQAGGALIDGAIDLMLHRRILTDDIGFGAFLNETENNEPIRAAGTHYLYLSKAHRNKIFEKKFAKEIALAPRVLTSSHRMYTDDMRKQFYDSKNEFSALKDKLPLGVHLLTLERITPEEMLVRLENYLEKVDATSDGVRYVRLRDLFRDIKVVWLKETLLAGNMYKDHWNPTQWRKKNSFYRRFNDYYGSSNDTFEEEHLEIGDELGGRGVRLAPQQIRTFIVKYKYNKI